MTLTERSLRKNVKKDADGQISGEQLLHWQKGGAHRMSQSDFMQMNLFSEDQDTAGILLSCASDSPLSCDKDPRPPITVTWNLWHGCKKVSPGCHTQAVPQGGVGRRGRQERSQRRAGRMSFP